MNTQGNAPSKLKMPKVGKTIDRGLYYGLQFAKNKESKRYHNILRDIAMAQMQTDHDNLDYKKQQGAMSHAEELLRLQAQNNANQGELNLKQKEQLMRLFQYAKQNGLDTSQLAQGLTQGADVNQSKMDNTKEGNEAFGTGSANQREGGGATPNQAPPTNHTVGDNTNPQPDNPNDNKEPFNETDTPDSPSDAQGSPMPNEKSPEPTTTPNQSLDTKETSFFHNFWNKHFAKDGNEIHSKQYYQDATNELQGKNADLQSNLDATNQSLANEQEARQKAENERDYAKKDADINFQQNLDATKYGEEADAKNQALQNESQEALANKDKEIQKAKNELAQNNEDSQRAGDFNKQVVNGLTDERNNLSNENKSLQSDKENLTNENQSLKTDNENVNKQLQDKDQYIKDHDAYMFNREQKHDKQNAKDLEIAKSETARAQADKASQKAKYEKQIGGLTNENSKLRNSNDNLKSQSDKYKSDSEIKDKLLGNQNANNVKLERSNKNLSTRNANERKQHKAELESQKANYEGQLKDRDNTIANQTNELNNTKAQMDKQTKAYAKDIQASKGETSRAQFKLGQANAKNQKLTAQNKQLTGDNKKLSGDNKHLHSFLNGLSKIGKKGGGNSGSNSNQ